MSDEDVEFAASIRLLQSCVVGDFGPDVVLSQADAKAICRYINRLLQQVADDEVPA